MQEGRRRKALEKERERLAFKKQEHKYNKTIWLLQEARES